MIREPQPVVRISRIARQVAESGAGVITVVAPPGYGKGSIGRAVGARSRVRTACRIKPGEPFENFLRRFAEALGTPAGPGCDSVAEMRSTIEAVWQALPAGDVLLEDCHHASRIPGALQFLEQLLAMRPAEVRVTLLSQDPGLNALVRGLPPHAVLQLGARQLRLTAGEVDAALAGHGLAAEQVNAVRELADGWPLAVRYFAECGSWPGADPVVALTQEFAESVVARFDPPVAGLLGLMAWLPPAGAGDLELAGILDQVSHADPELVRRTPHGAYELHPFARALVQRSGRAALQRDAGLPAVQDRRRSDAIGPSSGQMPATGAGPELLAELIDGSYGEFALKLWPDEYPRHGEADATAAHRRWLPVAAAARRVGRLSEAQSSLDRFQHVDGALADALRPYTEVQRALVEVAAGRIADAQARLDQATAGRPGAFPMERLEFALQRARLLGEWDEVLRVSEIAVEIAARTNPEAHSYLTTRYAFNCWWAGQDAEAASGMARARRLSIERGDREFALVDAVCRGDERVVGAVVHGTLGVALTYAFGSKTETGARVIAERILRHMPTVEAAFFAVAGRIALAELLPERAAALGREAAERAAQSDAAPLQAAVHDWLAGRRSHGMLAPMLARSDRLPWRCAAGEARLNFYSGTLSIAGRPVFLSERAFELLAALAWHPQIARDELLELVWPGVAQPAARNALKTCVYRVREAAGDRDVLVQSAGCYRLSPRVGTDLDDLDGAVRDFKLNCDRGRLEATALAAMRGSLAYCDRFAWAGAMRAELEGRRRSALLLTCRSLLDEQKSADLDLITAWLLSREPCDRQAAEFSVRSALAAGDPLEAARRYRSYVTAVEEHLGVRNDQSLAYLLAEGA